MNKVVDLNSRRPNPHLAGTGFCINCSHKWEAVRPVGTTQLECPRCGTYNGVMACPIEADDGVARWQCNKCNGQYFQILEAGALCIRCGVIHDWAAIISE